MKTDEPSEEYHAKRGLYMTSHLLIAAFGGQAELVKDFREPRGETTSLYFGRAAHVYTLEGAEKFESEYVVGGPVNEKTGKTYGASSKTYKAWADAQPLPAITPEELSLIKTMDTAVRRERAAVQLLAEGHAETTGRCEIEGVPCQVRLDWLTPAAQIADYKTTRSLATFSIDCEQYGYLIQQAFYRQCAREITGTQHACYLIAAEKNTPSAAIVMRLHDELLDEQEAKNRAKIVEVRDLFFRLRKERQQWLSEASLKNYPRQKPPRPRQQKPAVSTTS